MNNEKVWNTVFVLTCALAVVLFGLAGYILNGKGVL